ncbi:MAG: hypothetical protein O2960_28495 [Verrucomicrobia bacterium]|nr:hypothetical protein [Verrucomicrobiota bacterium]
MDEKTLKRAAAWIYKNRHTGYWTFPILVGEFSSRPDVRALRLSPDDADAVFAALEKRGFLQKRDGEMLCFAGTSIQKYRIEYSSIGEFRKFSEIPFYYFLPASWIYYLEKYWAWFVVCIALVVTSFFQGFVGKLGEWVGTKITGN